MIGFDYPDGHGNAETLVPVNLTVLPKSNITSNSLKMMTAKILLINQLQNKLDIRFSMYMQVIKGMLQ